MIELHPASLRLLGLRHWQQRCAPVRTDAPSQKAHSKSGSAAGLTPDAGAESLPVRQQALLEKILAAVGLSVERCHVSVVGKEHVRVTLADGFRLEFNKLSREKDNDYLALASLSAMLTRPELKKPVWEKLKAWRRQCHG